MRYNPHRIQISRFVILAMLITCLSPACSAVKTALAGSSDPAGQTQNVRSTPASIAVQTTLTSGPELPTATAQPPLSLWVSPDLPADLEDALDLPAGLPRSETEAAAALSFGVITPTQTNATNTKTTDWVFTLAAPFPTVSDGVSLDELTRGWANLQSGPFGGRPLLMDESTLAAMTALFGAPGEGVVEIHSTDELLDTAWADQPSWAVIPFEEIQPRWKVLTVDGMSPLDKAFNIAEYPLTVSYGLLGDPGLLSRFQSEYVATTEAKIFPESNRDPELFTEVVMTGVTALSRAIAYKMEINGIDYPAEEIGDILREGDITHVSNEVAFAENCPYPDPNTGSLRFCSSPSYLQLLTDVGVDVVELSGNHVNDWGADNLAYSLDLYNQAGLKYFAGGANIEESRKPVLIENHGNKIAFIGCNTPGPINAWATDTQAGAANCEGDWLLPEVTRLREQGWLPIVTLQFAESYNPVPLAPQVNFFQSIADAGAVIVSGSQAHLPQGFGFKSNALIHYGLGNLFFDQMHVDGLRPDLVGATRWEFIDRHSFYNGKYLGVNLVTAMLEDYAQPRLMTTDERNALLELIFDASDWNN